MGAASRKLKMPDCARASCLNLAHYPDKGTYVQSGCKRRIEVSWSGSIEVSVSKDGKDFYERDLRRIEVLGDVRARRRTVAAAG